MHPNPFSLYLLLFVGSSSRSSLANDNRMPFYVIGHMANRMADVHRFLDDGANSVETDVAFSSDGRPVSTYHGFPCDCWRFCFWSQTFSSYLTSLRTMIVTRSLQKFQGSQRLKPSLALVYLDLKTSKINANTITKVGQTVAEFISKYFIAEGLAVREMPWIILGVPDVSDTIVFKEFKSTMIKLDHSAYIHKFGFDVYGTFKDISVVLKAMHLHNLTGNVWLGDGMSNCFPGIFRPRANLDKLIKMRDIGRRNRGRGPLAGVNGISELPMPDGVYYWTVDKAKDMRSVMGLGLNGIVTNSPATLVNVLEEKRFVELYRLATVADRPWG